MSKLEHVVSRKILTPIKFQFNNNIIFYFINTTMNKNQDFNFSAETFTLLLTLSPHHHVFLPYLLES